MKRLTIFNVLLVVVMLIVLGLSFVNAAQKPVCVLPALGDRVSLDEGSWAGIWGEVLYFHQQGDHPPLMALRLSDFSTIALVDGCVSWRPSTGLVGQDVECAEDGDVTRCVGGDSYPLWMPD